MRTPSSEGSDGKLVGARQAGRECMWGNRMSVCMWKGRMRNEHEARRGTRE